MGWNGGKPLAADEESESRSSDYKDTEDDPGDDPGGDPDGDPAGGAGPSTSTTRL